MEIIFIDDCQINIGLSDLEITVINNTLIAVKNTLDREPEFKTRVGFDYAESQSLIASLSNNCIIDSEPVALINNLLNEVCNGIKIGDFDSTIGIPKVEAKAYLRVFSQLTNKLHS